MSSLVDQIFQQADAGSANGQGFGEFFAKGVQQGQEQQRINLAQQQLAAELAMQPLKQTLMQQQSSMQALNLTNMLEQRQAMISTESALSEATNLASQAIASSNPEDAEAYVLDIMSRTKGAYRNPKFHELLQDTRASLAGRAELQRLKNEAKASYTPGFSVIKDQLTGQLHTVFQSSANSAQLVKDPNLEHTAATTNFDKLSKLQDAYATATQSGDPAAIATAKRNLDTFQALAVPASESMTLNPSTGEVTITKGKQLGDLTQANQTQVQKELSSSLATIDTADRLLPLIDNETVGVQAFAESWVKDRILAQRFPELASTKRANAEVLSAQLRSSAIKDLRSDSNISEPERRQILQAIPAINDPVDSPARAKQLVQQVQQMAAIHAVVKASMLKQPIPPAAASKLNATELTRLVKAGVITKEQAIATFDAR